MFVSLPLKLITDFDLYGLHDTKKREKLVVTILNITKKLGGKAHETVRGDGAGADRDCKPDLFLASRTAIHSSICCCACRMPVFRTPRDAFAVAGRLYGFLHHVCLRAFAS
jgi:hypothetical protein